MSPEVRRPGYGVVVPVKPPTVAKSRLSSVGDQVRRELVVAFAADTVVAALGSPIVSVVLVVTDDHELARGLSELGAEVIPDGISENLNGSLALAAAELARNAPELRIAALCADLPALRAEELTRALTAAVQDRQCFVADEEETGTTLLTAPTLGMFEPCFGAGSREAHLSVGATELDLADVPTLRRDVDTTADLARAIELGLGSRTARVRARHRL